MIVNLTYEELEGIVKAALQSQATLGPLACAKIEAINVDPPYELLPGHGRFLVIRDAQS